MHSIQIQGYAWKQFLFFKDMRVRSVSQETYTADASKPSKGLVTSLPDNWNIFISKVEMESNSKYIFLNFYGTQEVLDDVLQNHGRLRD